MLLRGLLFSFLISFVVCLNVTFDNRAFLLDGERTLFVGGSIHYPRAQSAEWPNLVKQAKDNGINLIQTYVFGIFTSPRRENIIFHPMVPAMMLLHLLRNAKLRGST
mmetsp:Transcript_86196/g.168602  ORF Transcript_86196/g.168602 Transcript_86196/m.168602 type:complete len:107 (+) Transcript_86196:1-321(+)